MYQVILSDEARQDEIDSYDYYELQRPGLGEEFLIAMENCYNSIRSHPLSYSFIDEHKTLRDVKVRRFPFVVIFEISGNNIFVYAVHNTHKAPFSQDE